MTPRFMSAVLGAMALAAGVSIGLAHHSSRPAARRSVPDHPTQISAGVDPVALPASGVTFTKSGITLRYPAAWLRAPAKTAELAVAAPTGTALLQLDVPTMGWHSPIIPIGLVASGYIDALRKSALPDAAVQDTADLTVAGAKARRLTARGHAAAGGGVCVDTAVVMVHKGQVYILSCDSDDANTPVARATLDAAVASIQWAK